MIRRIGVRAHDFGKNSADEIADIVSGYGFGTIQLAVKKAITNLTDINEELNKPFARSVTEKLKNKGIDISVLGCYLNYGQTDDDSRLANLDIFLKHVDLCEDFEAGMVGTETGSLNADYSFSPENHGEKAYKIFLHSVEKMMERAEEKNVLVAIEAVSRHIINTPERMKRIVDDIASPNLVVILDPVNLITPENYVRQDRVIRTFFDLLGDKIAAVHAKDFILENDKIRVTAAGKGMLSYDLFLDLVKQSDKQIDILLENIKPEDMAASKRFIESTIDGR